MKLKASLIGIAIGLAAYQAGAGGITCTLNPPPPNSPGVYGTAGALSGTFEADDFSFNINDLSGEGDQASGSGAGTTASNSAHITKALDGLSSPIFELAATGGSLQSIACTINGQSPAGVAPGAGLTATLSNVTIVAYKVTKTSAGAPREQVSLNFSKIQVTYTQQK